MEAAKSPSRKWWWILIGLVVLLVAFGDYKPEWYAAEADTMERVSDLLNAPVPYLRRGDGVHHARHVSHIILPPVEVRPDALQSLVSLIRELPELRVVVCAYVPDQRTTIDALNEEFGGRFLATHDLGASTQRYEEMQRETYVAGIHRGSDYATAGPGPERHRDP
ncbi:MAG: hypothetical protein AAGD14_10500 [Planctomycetota bacterium]